MEVKYAGYCIKVYGPNVEFFINLDYGLVSLYARYLNGLNRSRFRPSLGLPLS
jgi:hypothetical protein